MTDTQHFLEAHYYSGGLRHQAYPNGQRPAWAPPADSVGFQDEFELADGDCAIEIRRFAMGDDRITWLGLYRRSLDEKLGDRKNHAGLGVWLRNCVPTDVQGLLYGLDNLASFLAKSIDLGALDGHASKFMAKGFLPDYLRPLSDYPHLDGIPFSPASMVDTDRYFAHCSQGPGECRALSDTILTQLLFGHSKPTRGRALYLVSEQRDTPPSKDSFEIVSSVFDAGTQLANAMPQAMKALIERAEFAEASRSDLEAKLNEAESERSTLMAEHGELIAFRDDPLMTVLRRLDRMSEQIASLSLRNGGNYAPLPPARSSPIRSGNGQRSIQPEAVQEFDWVKIVAWIFIVAALMFMAYMAVDLLVRSPS